MKIIIYLILLSCWNLVTVHSQTKPDISEKLFIEALHQNENYFRSLNASNNFGIGEELIWKLRKQMKYKFVLTCLLNFRNDDNSPILDFSGLTIVDSNEIHIPNNKK